MQTQDKTFVVTGAGNGIGREVAAVHGHVDGLSNVAGVDLRGDALERTAALAGAGDRFTSHAVDITDQAAQALPAAEAARIIVDKAVEKGDYRVTVGKDATFLDRLSRFAPQRATDMIAKKMASLLG